MLLKSVHCFALNFPLVPKGIPSAKQKVIKARQGGKEREEC